METSFVSASPADQDPGLAASENPASKEGDEEEEETKKKEEEVKEEKLATIQPNKGNARFRLRPLDRLEHGGYFIDCNYYTPITVNERRYDVKFYENLKKQVAKLHKLKRKLQLRKQRRLARENPCKNAFNKMHACASCQPFVTLKDKLNEVKLLFGELYPKKEEGGEGEKGEKKEEKVGEMEVITTGEEADDDKNKVKKKGGKKKKVKKEKRIIEVTNNVEVKKEELERNKMEENLDDKKNLDFGDSHPARTWEDMKINRKKHPLDPSCYGDEIIKKIIQKKKPKRRLKVPFTCKSQLQQRLSPEIEDRISQLPPQTSENVAMVLNIGRQRPLYQEQYDNVKHFENSASINVNWAKLAVSAVQTSSNSTRISRMLVPVLCEKLVKLIKYNDELKMYDGGVEYGIDMKLVLEEEEEESKEEEKGKGVEEDNQMKRKCVSAVVKNVVAKLVDSVVAEEEGEGEVDSVKIVSHTRVGRELKRLNASYIELEELASSPKGDAPVTEENNLAKVEKEYHQTVVKKKDEIIFVNNKNKRLRRRPLKLEDHVLEVGEDGRGEVVKRRTDIVKEIRTEELFAEEPSNPPVKDCSVKLVKTLNVEDKEKVENSSSIEEKNDVLDETYIEDTCSLPKFQIKVPDNVTRPPMFRLRRSQEDTTSPSKSPKKRKIEEKKQISPVSSKSSRPEPGKILIDLDDLKNSPLEMLLKSNKTKDAKTTDSKHARFPLGRVIHSSSPTSSSSRVLNKDVSILPAGKEQKRIKTMKPLRRVKEPEISVKIQSVMSLNPEISVSSKRRTDLFQEVCAPQGKAAVIPTEVRFLIIPIDQQFEQFTHKDNKLKMVFGRGKLSYALTILSTNTNNEMVFIPTFKTIKHNEDKFFGVYFHHKSPLKVFVGPYQLDEDPEIYIKFKSDPETVKFAGDFCMNDDFVIAFWKCHNRWFERRICKDPGCQELAVYVYRQRNQQKSTNESVLNVSQEADKLAKNSANESSLSVSQEADKLAKQNRHQSWLNSIKNFESRSTKNSVENVQGDSPAVDTRPKSPDLDIVKMEIDIEDSVDESEVSRPTPMKPMNETEDVEMLEHIVNNETHNNDVLVAEPTMNSSSSGTGASIVNSVLPETPDSDVVLIDEKTVDNGESPISSKSIIKKKKQLTMKSSSKVKDSTPQSIDKSRSHYDYARNLNKLALNNVELSYRVIEDKSRAKKGETPSVSKALKEADAVKVRKLAISGELEIIRRRVESGSSKNQTNNTTQGANEAKIVATIDLCDTEASVAPVPVAGPSARSNPAAKLNVVKNATSPVKKVPNIEKKSYPLIGFRRIEPKPAASVLDQGAQKMFFRINTSKSILNPVKKTPISQAPSTASSTITSAKSVLKCHNEQRTDVQTLPQQALQQQALQQQALQQQALQQQALQQQALQQQALQQQALQQQALQQQALQQKALQQALQQKALQQALQQKALQQQVFVQATNVGSQAFTLHLVQQKPAVPPAQEITVQQVTQEEPSIEAKQSTSQTILQNQVSSNLMKLVEEKIQPKQTISIQTSPEKQTILQNQVSSNLMKLVGDYRITVQPKQTISKQASPEKQLVQQSIEPSIITETSPLVPEQKTAQPTIGLKSVNNQIPKMIRLGGNKILVMGGQPLKVINPQSLTLPKIKEIGLGKFIKIPILGQKWTSKPVDEPPSTNSCNISTNTVMTAEPTAPSSTSISTIVTASTSTNTPVTTDPPVSSNTRGVPSTDNVSTHVPTSINTIMTNDLPASTSTNTPVTTDPPVSSNTRGAPSTDNVSTHVPTSINTIMTNLPATTSTNTPVTTDPPVSSNTQGAPSTDNVSTHVPTSINTIMTNVLPASTSTNTLVDAPKTGDPPVSSNTQGDRPVSSNTQGAPSTENVSTDVPTPLTDETSTTNNGNELQQDPDALKIVSNWKYNSKYMQSLGLFVDEEDF